MNAKLKSLYWKFKKVDSVATALKQIVVPAEVEKFELKGMQGGELLETISFEQGYDSGSLLMAVANLLDLAALDGQYNFDKKLSAELQIPESFLEKNNALLCLHQQNRLLLAADINPELKDVATKYRLELCLGLLSNIKKSWSNYHNFSLTTDAVDTKKLEFVLKNLVIDADKFGANQIEILVPTGAYSFIVAAEVFEGNIHPLVATALSKWLEGKSKLKAKLVQDWQEPVVFYKKNQEDLIVVSWSRQVEQVKIVKTPPVVLLLEDDRLFSTVLKSTLEKNNYKVFCFYTAEQALAALSAGDLMPDLVVSDLHLPGINGDEFLDRFRELNADVPFIILTSDEDQLTEAEVVLKGVGAYLKKNEDIRIILAWCSQLLTKYVD